MRVSAVKAVLTQEDILGIMKEYIKVEGLSFEDLTIDDFINLEGVYKKGINIPFKVKLGLGNIKDNVLNIKIFNVSVAKIGILKGIKNFALKKFLKEFEEYGIKVDKETISLDLNGVSKFVPFFYFKLNKITLTKGAVEAEIEDIVYAENKETIDIKEKVKDKDYKAPEDCYTNFRQNIEEKVPDKYEKIVEYAMIIPDIVALLWRIFRDKRVSTVVKGKAVGVIGYLAMPFDIIPDFIPFIGKVDDVAIAFYGLNSIINDIPEEIILENWQGDKDIILTVREGVKYISGIVGSENVAKLLNTIKNLSKGENKKEEKIFSKKNVSFTNEDKNSTSSQESESTQG